MNTPTSPGTPYTLHPRVAARRDHQRRATPPPTTTRTHAQESHTNKMYRYRDRLLHHLNGRIDADLMFRVDERSHIRLGSVPPNTEIALYADLCGYAAYCVSIDISPFPVTEHGLDGYISVRMAKGHKRTTIDRAIASLCTWHQWLELDDPRASFTITARIAHVKQKSSQRRRQKEGLRAEHLKHALAAYDPHVVRDAGDIALLFTAFESLGRRSELVRLTWEDLTIDPKDHSGLLHFAFSKTDQDQEGAYQYLSPVTVNLLLHWQTVLGRKTGALFRGIYSDGSITDTLSEKGVARAFKRIARRLNLPESLFAAHSTRIGAAQEMVERDIDSASIMLAGRWKSIKMVTVYAQRIHAKKSGMAKLTDQMGWQHPEDILLTDESQGSDNP